MSFLTLFTKDQPETALITGIFIDPFARLGKSEPEIYGICQILS